MHCYVGVVSDDFYESWHGVLKSLARETPTTSDESLSSFVNTHILSFIKAYSQHLLSAASKNSKAEPVVDRPGFRKIHHATEVVTPDKSESQLRDELVSKLPSKSLDMLLSACSEIGDLSPFLVRLGQLLIIS